MNYEKKYKEALQRARLWKESNRTAVKQTIIEDIFPELEEVPSEDVRIRNQIISFLDRNTYQFECDRDKSKGWIAWLKKHTPVDKETALKLARMDVAMSIINFIDVNTQGIRMSTTECKNLEDAIISYNWAKVYAYMKRKLDKQGERNNYTLPKFAFDDVLALQCCMETANKVQEDIELYEQLQSLHNRVHDAYWLEKQGKQNPVEWSKEDEAMRDFIIRIMEIQFPHGTFSAGEFKAVLKKDVIPVKMVIDWLKSLSPQDHCKNDKEQKRIYGWMARDKDGDVRIFDAKPDKYVNFGEWLGRGLFRPSKIPDDLNPRWEDEEPIEVELTIRRKGK